jgi:hypothetical protein
MSAAGKGCRNSHRKDRGFVIDLLFRTTERQEDNVHDHEEDSAGIRSAWIGPAGQGDESCRIGLPAELHNAGVLFFGVLASSIVRMTWISHCRLSGINWSQCSRKQQSLNV